ncbi:hypothetical protein N7481_002707 [Penicillium waksmanii]|uniref:uncharacterized protein n=1 Tax=Penicillium waksmanii TaxID=69791 RepID=UPI0025470E8F|nr:uncharacterized protein N7481_002707 [Penicillium waksmanii]KAJ5995730.1 hypothetical protein N7481_002707 [Penicillium waksmanii]
MLKVRQRKRNIVASFRGGSETKLRDAGVDTLIGEATFVDEKTLEYKDSGGNVRTIQGQKIFINVGARPAPPLLEGIDLLDRRAVLDSTSIQELDEVPSHLVVVGGGIAPSPSGFTLYFHVNNGDRTVEGTHILFATGRIPNTDSLKPEAAGIDTDKKGYIVTNEYLETSSPSIFAIGDVKGPPAFTHISYDDFRILRSNMLSLPPTRLSTKDRIVPYVVFTDPQLAHVGLHEKEARVKFPNKRIQTAKMPMAYVARALETDESRGMMKAVVDGDTGLILGFSCLGIEGGEIMSIVEVAMIGNQRV